MVKEEPMHRVLAEAYDTCTVFRYGLNNSVRERKTVLRARAITLIGDTLFSMWFGLGGDRLAFGFADGSALSCQPEDEQFIVTVGRMVEG
jgi:hypothetical protein